MNCRFCGFEMWTDDKYGCPNCYGEGLDGEYLPQRKKLKKPAQSAHKSPQVTPERHSGEERGPGRSLGRENK